MADPSPARHRIAAPDCPVCGRPALAAWRPFCSRRCADVDLGRWLNEDYRIPADPADDDTAADDDGPADGGSNAPHPGRSGAR